MENQSSTVPGAIGANAAAIAITATAVPIARRAEITQSGYRGKEPAGKDRRQGEGAIRARTGGPAFSQRSSRSVQSQSQHAQGSSPLRSRHRLRAWASFTCRSSKCFSQYARSSARGVEQKHTSTHLTRPSPSSRACAMLRRYSSPATDPAQASHPRWLAAAAPDARV